MSTSDNERNTVKRYTPSLSSILFHPGQIAMNADCYHALREVIEDEGEFQAVMRLLIGRHVTGNWGDVDEHDKGVNNAAVKSGARIISSYDVNGVTVWIITEAAQTDDPKVRQVTTFLRPIDY